MLKIILMMILNSTVDILVSSYIMNDDTDEQTKPKDFIQTGIKLD